MLRRQAMPSSPAIDASGGPPKPIPVVIFAHVPPPHHGQSQMVQWLVEGLRARPELGVEILHVDARLSTDLTDVGSARGGKIWLLFRYVWQAIRYRISRGARVLYYVPSPPKRNSLYRDWIVLGLLRPWLSRVVFHWHAVGLGAWVETQARPCERWVSHRLLGRADLSVILAEMNRGDAEKFGPKSCVAIGNGIPDPCPEFDASLAVQRTAELAGRRQSNRIVRVLFLAHCTRDKGLFDAMDAIAEANRLAQGKREFQLTVAGSFVTFEEEKEFRDRIEKEAGRIVKYIGFVSGEGKSAAFRDHEIFLFPTYFANEGQPLNLIEAMAWGLPIVTTRWRAIPEFFDTDYAGLVEPKQPASAAAALLRVAPEVDGCSMRRRFVERYSLDKHLEAMAMALRDAA